MNEHRRTQVGAHFMIGIKNPQMSQTDTDEKTNEHIICSPQIHLGEKVKSQMRM